MKRFAALLLLLTLMRTGCFSSAPASTPAGSETEPLPVQPDLMALQGPGELPLDHLLVGLNRYLAQGEGAPTSKLDRLFQQWGLTSDETRKTHVEADLNGDGQPEVVTALNGSGTVTGLGALLVLHQENGRVSIDRGETLPGVALFQVVDLTGDSQPEILWYSTSAGAHTTTTQVFVSTWQPGEIQVLPGSMSSTNVRLATDGEEILLIGGTISSAGAGTAQRVRTDRYRWQDGAFALVDQRYEPSGMAYHRLLDGITAESFGRLADAEAAYREAAEASRQALAPEMVPPEAAEGFGHAVRTFARFRLGALFLQSRENPDPALEGATGPYVGLLTRVAPEAERTAYCQAAESWSQENPGFLEALNSPFGYANPRWAPANLCGPLPPAE